MEILENRILTFRTRQPEKYSIIPKCAAIGENNGVYEMAVSWGYEEARILKNLGVKDVPSPIKREYNWPGLYKPMEHQIETAGFLTMHHRAFCFNDVGTGKSLSCLWAADYLMNKRAVRRVLILCPLSIMNSAWLADLSKSILHRSAAIAYASTASKRKEIVNGGYEFVISNYDGLEIIDDEIIKDGRFDLVIVDECNSYKNITTRKWKVLNKVLRPTTRLWMLTGTPAPQSPVDAFGLAKFVNPGAVPKFTGAWRDKVLVKVAQFKWKPRPEAPQIVFNALQPAIRFTKEQCLDLPPVVVLTREVPLTPQQDKYYKQMKREQLVKAAGETVSSANAAIAINKLLQISCIAYNTPVLTEHGWTPIQDVRDGSRVWDGTEWVHHFGALYKGIQNTIICGGVRMTPEHKVLTANGWREAAEVMNGNAGERFDGVKVRLPDGFKSGGYVFRENKKSDLALSVRLRRGSSTGKSKLTFKASPQRKTLRMPARGAYTCPRNVLHTPIQNLVRHAKKMSRHERQRLQKLWGAGHNNMRRMEIIPEFLERHARGVRGALNFRQKKQQFRLQQMQLQMGNCGTARQQYAEYAAHRNSTGSYDHYASGKILWDKKVYSARKNKALRLERGESASDKVAVYDLLNCGPRNRFTVMGENGELLIVHNCGAVYSDDGATIDFDCAPRLNALLEVLEETDRKVIVFVPFKHAIEKISGFLSAHGSTPGVINGDVSLSDRTRIFKDFQRPGEEPRVVLIQPQAAAHGVTLTAADTVVFWGPVTSVELYKQAIGRADRIGQNAEKVTVLHMQSSDVERRLYKQLQGNLDTNQLMLDLYTEEFNT